uniref:Uncharacterized protein n=1 Tax=Eutreptiella gymnastica TaxID=73025 RepID=A0A7S4G6Z8_9EUGL
MMVVLTSPSHAGPNPRPCSTEADVLVNSPPTLCPPAASSPLKTSSMSQADCTDTASASKSRDDHMKEAPCDGCKYLDGAPMCHETVMTHQPYSFPGVVGFGYIEDDDDSAGGHGKATEQYYEDHCPSRPSDRFTSIASETSKMQLPCTAGLIHHTSLGSSSSQLQYSKDVEMQLQRQNKRYLAMFGDSEEPKTGWERLEDGQIACHDRKLLFSTALQCRNYLVKSGYVQSPAALAQEEGAEFLAHLDAECLEERSKLRKLQKSVTKQKNAVNQEMKVHVAQFEKANRRLVHENTVLEHRLAKLEAQQKQELEAAQALQRRALESLTRLMQFCDGLPPFIATFKHEPVSRRLVVVVALGPYGFSSDEDGRANACRFSEFAAVNGADLLFLSLHTRIPGLKLQAAQLMKTQIEEHILKTHGAAHDWERICVVDETFSFPDGYVRVFDEVSEESVLVVQPGSSEAVNLPKCKVVPSMFVMHAKHDLLLEQARKVFFTKLFSCTTKSQGYEAAHNFVWSLTTACAELGIRVCLKPTASAAPPAPPPYPARNNPSSNALHAAGMRRGQ